MPTRLRKVRRQRGSRTHGWGQVGQHRKHGMKGGRGKAGLHKHKWSWVVKYAPDYFGKSGFRCPTGAGALKTVNVGELDEMVDRLVAEGKARLEDGKYFAEISELGFDKLLGGGEVTRPIVVKAPLHSETAAKKIEAAGGKVIPAD